MTGDTFGPRSTRFAHEALSGLRPAGISTMIDETWKPCPDFEHWYEVSNLGRVRSSARGETRILALGTDSSGYLTVAMNKNGRRTTRTVHRLVCRAFHGEPRPSGQEAAHLDGNRANAVATNLEWVSKAQNIAHKKTHGTFQEGEKCPSALITADQARSIKDMLRAGQKVSWIAQQIGCSYDIVREIQRERTWRSIG